MRILIVALLLAVVGCDEKKPESPEPAKPRADRWFAEPDQVSAALASAAKKVASELRGGHLVRVTAVGIDPEGRLHPRFGSLELEFQREFDPDLPIGAPLSAHEEKTCLVLGLGPEGWTGHQQCGPKTEGVTPKCTARTIWKRALKDGAPTGAIASISFEGLRWRFEIDDPRARVSKTYPDNCEAEQTAEARVEVGEDIEYTPGASMARTGERVCDELIRKTRCMYDRTSGVPKEAKEAFEDAIKMWKEALLHDATRQATLDACEMSLEGGKSGFDAMGC